MKVPDTEENMMKCICGGCPTYNACMEKGTESLFCARGKTGCELDKQGCLCGECPISGEYQLSGMYFCEMGAAE